MLGLITTEAVRTGTETRPYVGCRITTKDVRAGTETRPYIGCRVTELVIFAVGAGLRARPNKLKVI